MDGVLDIRVQKLFLVVLVLKVLSSGLAWYFGYPWSLGFWIPLGLMSTYIVLGLKRHDSDVTDEKFADTCYYLGFIFTITSIIFSLFDLPNIGTRIQDIAVRFGAAMVSTVLGLGVRVYLVSFKRDVADAIRDAEDAVIEASQRFQQQLVIAFEKLRDFQSEVDLASRATVERVNLQVEALSKNHADKLTDFFAELTTRNQEAFTNALAEVRAASVRLTNSVDGYSKGMQANLASIEGKVVAFTAAVTDRLRTTTFPDDYFAKNLAGPLTQLQSAAGGISETITRVSAEVGQSSVVLSGALKKLRDKAGVAEGSLDTVLKLTEQQQAVLTAAQGQLTSLEQLNATLVGFEALFTKTLAGINASSDVSSELVTKVQAVVTEGAEARKSLDKSVSEVVLKLGANAHATEALGTHVGANAAASKLIATQLAESASTTAVVAGKLAANSAASALVAGKLDAIAAADIEAAKKLSSLGEHASMAIDRVDAAVEQLQGMVRQLASLDTALRAQSSELRGVAERIKDVRVTVETPATTAREMPLLSALSVPIGMESEHSDRQPTLPGHLAALVGGSASTSSAGNGAAAGDATIGVAAHVGATVAEMSSTPDRTSPQPPSGP
jgi:hypothetical protein